MKNLYLRIYVTVVVVLLLFASTSGWIFHRHLEHDRERADALLVDRMSAWAELIQHSLPNDAQPAAEQAAALRDWSARLRLPLALDSASGGRIGESESFARRRGELALRAVAVQLEDGRTLWIMRPWPPRRAAGGGGATDAGDGGGRLAVDRPPRAEQRHRPDEAPPPPPLLPFFPPEWQQGVGLVVVLAMLFVAVSVGAFPVVRRLTRRLETLKRGVEQFGAGHLDHRIAVSGNDEVAAVAASFNVAAARIEALVRSHQSLLANASHELRSPLARMKMAVSLLESAAPGQRAGLKHEIDTDVAELDALVEEVLLASRLDAAPTTDRPEPVELLGVAAEEGARVGARVGGVPATVLGEDRLLRRAVRNLLENARRYGGGSEVEIEVDAPTAPAGQVEVRVRDRGPGVAEAMRERIFEPFFRLPGHAEQAGGVGLGLSLVKQIAERHRGSVRCEGREGGGSCFVLTLPLPAVGA